MLTMSKFLIGIFNQKLIPCILRYAGIREQTKVSELSKTSFSALLHACKNMEFVITDTNGFEQAQVCAGGIRFDEVSHDTMGSLCCKMCIRDSFGMEPYFSTGFLNGSSHVFYYIYQDICSDMRFVIIKNLDVYKRQFLTRMSAHPQQNQTRPHLQLSLIHI